MEEYTPNSYKSKQEAAEPKIEPVISAPAHIKKKNTLQKVADTFFVEDFATVRKYVLMEMLIPGVKRMVLKALEMWMLKDKGGSKKNGQGVSTVSYRDYYEQPAVDNRSYRNSDYADFDDILFETRGDAELVKSQMEDILTKYRVVRVSDMFELARMTAPYTANRYGWTALSSAMVVPMRDGWTIKMPRAMPLD